MSFFAELKRRNVFRVAAAYIIVGWLILQVGEVLAPALHLPDWVNSLLAFFILLGFPLALFFAWAFELTPEGLKKEKDVIRGESLTQHTGRKLDFAIIGLLVLAVAYFAVDKWVLAPDNAMDSADVAVDGSAGPPTIAVLPLADMSPEGDHEYFSDGLTEELLNILAKIQELQVAGRTSSFAFKGRNEDLREIGRQLNVGHILEGSVRKDEARNRVRITLQLINAEDGYHLWSETYDRDLDDIFAIQEEVAHEVAAALRVTLLGEDEARLARRATTEFDTYDLYLQGLQELHKAGFVNLDRAVERFQQVLAQDPAYTPARLGLAAAWGQMAATGAITIREAVDRGMPVLDQLLESEPDNPEVHRLRAAYLDGGVGDISGAESAFQKALELDPRNAQALSGYGRMLYDNGELGRGKELIEAAVNIEPMDIRLLFNSCQTSAQLRQLDQAVAACRRVQQIAPDGPQGYYGEALAHGFYGDVPRTMKGYAEAIERDPEDFEMLAAMAIFWVALDDANQARAWLDRAEAIGAGQPVPLSAAILLHELQEQYERTGELARQALEADMDDRHGTNFFFRRAHAMHALRTDDPEYGLAPYRSLLPWAFEAELEFPEEATEFLDDLLFVASLMKAQDPLADRPDALVAFVEQHVNEFHPGWGMQTAPWRRAAINVLRGQSQQAVEALREARDLGMMIYWRPYTIDNPVIARLDGDPEFAAFIEEYEERAAQQRETAHELMGLSP